MLDKFCWESGICATHTVRRAKHKQYRPPEGRVLPLDELPLLSVRLMANLFTIRRTPIMFETSRESNVELIRRTPINNSMNLKPVIFY